MFSTRLWALWVLFQALPLTNPPMVVGTDSSHSQRASRAPRATPRQHFHSTFFLESCIFFYLSANSVLASLSKQCLKVQGVPVLLLAPLGLPAVPKSPTTTMAPWAAGFALVH